MKQAKPGRRLLDGEATLPKQSGWAADSDQLENACVLYEELVGTRDRIADLGAINPKDMETVARALYEVVGYLLTPPPRAKTELRLPQATKHELAAAARSRKIETFVFAVALVALKLGKRENAAVTVAHQLAIIGDALDSISFDYRTPKRSILTTLRRLRDDIDTRISHQRDSRRNGYQFITTVVRQAVRQNREAGPIFSKGLCSSRRARTDSSRHSARRSQVL
ncbi:hypothetical protein [Bradyrhizobium sp.]|jgi:signal transduction histidine kinase|uniref:hypothetical protein n=1 Tax=Bradyrhizobium sp. TaxID=376 RepID=UPI003C1D1E5F